MASATTHRTARAGAAGARRASAGRSTRSRSAAASPSLALRVRWDRVARTALLFVLLVVIGLYVQPLRSYLSTRHAASREKAQVQSLEREHRALVIRQKALRDPRTLERSARALGMVRRTERSYVVRGLPPR